MKRISAAMLMLVGLAVVASVGACSPSGVAQSDVDAIKQQAAAQEQKAAALQQQLSSSQSELAKLQQALTAKDKEVADLKARPAGTPGVTVLIGAQKVPIPTPAPAATPVPGATPPPPPVPPASYYEPLKTIAVYMETLVTTRVSTLGYAATINCLNSNVFKRGQRIVYRFEVYDPTTGKRIADKDGATVIVRLPHGQELTARWSQRAGGRVPDAPWMWNTTWDIPLDYPLGGLDYSVVVTAKDGKSLSWKPPALVSAADKLDTRLQIMD